MMFASEFLDRLDALGDGPRHPVSPRFVGVFESPLRHPALNRHHAAKLPMMHAATRRLGASSGAYIVRPEVLA
jgi:hypothetical protein